MKGVVLAGGTGSRLFPLTKVTNKHLLPVGHYPMIFHPIAKLAQAGIHDILIVTGTEHMGSVVGVLGSGRSLGLDFTYRVQDRAGGIAEALNLAEGFVGGDRCVVILGDNILEDDLTPHVQRFSDQQEGAMVLLKEVPDAQRFGVAQIEDGRIVSIVEKPSTPASPFAVTGVYMYDADVFGIVQELEPSGRNELEITDVNTAYLARGTLEHGILHGWWTDAGTHDSLAYAQTMAENVILGVFDAQGSYRPAGH